MVESMEEGVLKHGSIWKVSKRRGYIQEKLAAASSGDGNVVAPEEDAEDDTDAMMTTRTGSQRWIRERRHILHNVKTGDTTWDNRSKSLVPRVELVVTLEQKKKKKRNSVIGSRLKKRHVANHGTGAMTR